MVWGSTVSSQWSGAEHQPKSILVHFSLKIWHLVTTILMIFLRINCTNYIGLEWHHHTKFQIGIAGTLPATPLPAPLACISSIVSRSCICVLCQVPSLLFLSSHAVSVITLGIPSGLVVDCGYAETVVLPVNIYSYCCCTLQLNKDKLTAYFSWLLVIACW